MKTIELEESNNIKIFKRFETKYLIDNYNIKDIIDLLSNEYLMVVNGTQKVFGYHSLYFDTSNLMMWNDHELDKEFRQKIRIREYDNGLKFLEIKEKNNGQTIKTRIPVESYNLNDEINWISNNLKYDTKDLVKSLDVRYHRMAFIKKDKSERITIDFDIQYHNYLTNNDYNINKIMILEIKKPYIENNKIENVLNDKFIYKQKFSKYHEGIKNTK